MKPHFVIDLDIDSAFELAQMQRQLSRWHIHWAETWSSDFNRGEILRMTEGWVDSFATCQTSARMHSGKTVAGCAKGDQLREMSGVFA